MSVPGVTPSSSNQGGSPPIQQVIKGALTRLKGKVLDIEAEEILDEKGKPDRDHNHRIKITLPSKETERASIFALKLNGKPKSEPDAITELTEKVEKHLENREKKEMVKLSSGAMVKCQPDAPIQEVNGYLAVGDKIAVLRSDEKYMPVPGAMIQSYTSFTAFAEEPLVIMTDDHEKVRDDEKEGMIFNLNAPLTLTKDQLEIHPKDENAEHLPEKGEYLILYRKREDARTTS